MAEISIPFNPRVEIRRNFCIDEDYANQPTLTKFCVHSETLLLLIELLPMVRSSSSVYIW